MVRWINMNIYLEAVAKWGVESQITLMVEESAELIKAIMKFFYRHGKKCIVVEELADVEIMCEQMRVIFDSQKIDVIKKQKLERLKNLLK